MAKTKKKWWEDRLRTLEPGQTYLFQTCTKDWVGRLVSIDGPFSVTLEEASWIADSGRLSQFMRTGHGGEHMEVEPVGIQAIQWLGWSPWPFKLFEEAI